VSKKKFDPLWEIVDEKRALQGVEPKVDVACPHCHVPLELGSAADKGQTVTCGLCGGSFEVVETPRGLTLKAG
jgi:transcription initiation factor IIE alpha subunit